MSVGATTQEIRREIEQAESMSMRLSAHATLFDAYFNDVYGLEQASLDPDTFFASVNELFEKVDELYGFVKGLADKLNDKGG